jgi:RNA polymerase sigma-70 factor (ECF subfamily)
MSTAGKHDPGRELSAFHAGDRSALEQCYRDHCDAVIAAAAEILRPVDAETVAHDVFHRLLTEPAMRASFRGGDLRAWLVRIAKNRAIDHRRKYARETELPDALTAPSLEAPDADRLSAERLVEKFRRDCLPPKWHAVFEARFLKQLGQREAARELCMKRTTLMYQEHRIRELLRKFVLEAP